MATSTPVPAPPYVVGVLNGIGAPINAATVLAMELWATAEGTTALPGNNGYNWINTVQPEPGSTNCTTCQQQSIQIYANEQSAIKAAVDTINQSSWAAIKAGFQAGTLQAIQNGFNAARAANGWGSWMPAGYPYVTSGNSPNILYTQGATTAYTASAGTTSAAAGTSGGATAGIGCNASAGWNIDLVIASPGLSGCQLKALKGGILTGLGGALMLVGGALIVVSGLAGKGPLAPVVAGAQSVLTGAKKLPGVGQSVPSGNGGPPSEASVTASDQRVISRERNRQEKAMSTPKIDKPNYQGGRPRRRTPSEDAARAEQPF